jgi:hypothetical protein
MGVVAIPAAGRVLHRGRQLDGRLLLLLMNVMLLKYA